MRELHFWSKGYKYRNTDGIDVWTKKETIVKHKTQLVTFHEGILVSLWTFQLTRIIGDKENI